MTLIKQGHVAVVPHAMWGHIRPLLDLCINLLTLHPDLSVTLLLSPSVTPRVEQELRNGDDHKHIASRLQLITCVSKDFDMPTTFHPEMMAKEAMDYAAVIPAFVKDLMEGNAEVQGTANKFKGVTPDFMIYDIFQTFAPDVFKGVAAQLGKKVPPFLGFCPSNSSAFYHHHASEEHGGYMAKMHRLAKVDMDNGKSPMEAFSAHGFSLSGEPKTLPGLPTKFDWPLLATCPVPPPALVAMAPSYFCVHDKATVGIILPSAAEMEPENVKALEEELGKRIYMVGPQFSEAEWTKPVTVQPVTDDDKRVFTFLSNMSAKHGPKSVCYVSFGSLFFPHRRPELVTYILQSLRDAGVPFVFAYASGLAQVPEGLLEEFAGIEDACLVKFAPQWGVLNHEATGWFVTHCGSNSTAEAILTETPIVSMPFAADQGEFASLLTEVYKVGIDLKQTKTFSNPAFTKLYDGTTVVGTEAAIKEEMAETWKRMRGPEGKEMRERMKGLRGLLKGSWEGGRSKADMLALGKCFE
ncbi:hypothetical protein IAT38_003960 [Cryptococcus sp. DSM 104549]